MSTNEVAASLDFIKTKLSANSTLSNLAVGGFHRGAAPVGTVAPWVTFQYQSGSDTLTFNVVRVLSRLLFLVKAVGPEAMTATVFQMAALIDDTLRKTSGVVTGAKIDACYRVEPVQYDEVRADGSKWVHCGGLYRPEVEQA
jgi:hypothetical protein